MKLLQLLNIITFLYSSDRFLDDFINNENHENFWRIDLIYKVFPVFCTLSIDSKFLYSEGEKVQRHFRSGGAMCRLLFLIWPLGSAYGGIRGVN